MYLLALYPTCFYNADKYVNIIAGYKARVIEVIVHLSVNTNLQAKKESVGTGFSSVRKRVRGEPRGQGPALSLRIAEVSVGGRGQGQAHLDQLN